MKLLLVLSCLVAAISAQDSIAGTLVAFSDPAAADPVVCTAADNGMKCDSCTSAIICAGSTNLGTKACESGAPFCDSATNSCGTKKGADCAVTFTCTQEGYFPDPDNCQIYYFCTDTLAVSQYDCPTNYVVDIANKNCKRKVYTSDCVTMKCTTANSFIVHAKDASYYTFCDANVVAHVIKCPTSQTFDKAAYGCKFVCKAAGYYDGPTAAQKYFCYKNGIKLEYTLLTCPEGYEYGSGTTCVKAATTVAPPA